MRVTRVVNEVDAVLRASRWVAAQLEKVNGAFLRAAQGEAVQNRLEAASELDVGATLREVAEYFVEGGLKAPRVRAGPSLVPGAGLGLFCDRDVAANTPLCFYPGEYTPPVPPALFLQFDGSHARPCTFLRQADNEYLVYMAQAGGFIDGKAASHDSALMAGHLVNHPPAGVVPNAWTLEFFWDELGVGTQSAARIPNWLTTQPWYIDENTGKLAYASSSCVRMPGMVMLAFRDIAKGEEVFWDYAISDGPKRHPWYHHVDYPAPRERRRGPRGTRGA